MGVGWWGDGGGGRRKEERCEVRGVSQPWLVGACPPWCSITPSPPQDRER